jgi:hypothetical protein
MDVRLGSGARDWTLGLSGPERRFLLGVLLFNAVLVVVIGGVKFWTGINLKILMQDVIVVAELPAYTGAYQFVAILFDATAAAIALFAVAASPPGGAREVRSLLALGGGYAAFACLDDLFTLHENGLFIGLPERGVMAIHAALLGWVAVKAWRLGPQTPRLLLGLSLGAMLAAQVLDLPGYHFPMQGVSEEVLETLGAALLASYLILTAYRLLAPRLGAEPARG